MVFLCVVGVSEYVGGIVKFCVENGFCYKGMVEIRKLRVQLINFVNLVNFDVEVVLNLCMNLFIVIQCKIFCQICFVGFGDYVVYKSFVGNNFQIKNVYKCMVFEDFVFIYLLLVLFEVLLEYVVYQEVVEIFKFFMKGKSFV